MKKILLGIISLLLITSVGYSEEQRLQLTIKSDKEVYKVGEEIWIEFEFKNITSERKDLLFDGCAFPLYHNFEFFDINGNPIPHKDPTITCTTVVSERKELLLGDKYISKIPLHEWQIIGSEQKYNNVGTEAREILIKGIYSSPPVAGEFINSDKIFWGSLTSNTINIEVVENKTGISKGKAIEIAKEYAVKQGYDLKVYQKIVDKIVDGIHNSLCHIVILSYKTNITI